MNISVKKYLSFIFFLFFNTFLPAQDRCVYTAILQKDIQKDAQLPDRLLQQELRIQQWIKEHSNILEERSAYTIPVVVHVLWNTPAENISDERIMAAIEALNMDYSASNHDLDKVPAIFQPLVAAIDIQFCLATKAADGSATSGITRTRTFVDSMSIRDVYYSDGEGHDAWDTNKYLNIWVANLKEGPVGFGSCPGQKIPEEDGIVIDYEVFGLNNHPRLNLGRTLTHEVGHYFCLLHLWGNKLFADCDEDDNIADTPRQDNSFGGRCPDAEGVQPKSCGSVDMYMNFMNFTNDECLHLFTQGQKLRMLASLLGPRHTLLNTDACPNITQPDPETGIVYIGPNPTSGIIYLNTYLAVESDIELDLFTVQGQLVYRYQALAVDTYFSHLIDGQQLSTGLYLLSIKIGKQRKTYKIIIR